MKRLSETPVVAAGSVLGYEPIFNAGLIHHDVLSTSSRAAFATASGETTAPAPASSTTSPTSSSSPRPTGAPTSSSRCSPTGSPESVHSYEDPRVQRVQTAEGEQVVMSYTNVPAPESEKPWRVGVHRLAYEQGRFRLNPTSGRVIGPEGQPDKDAVLFNLRNGSVGLIHRIYPNMQLALFGSLEELWESGAAYSETHLRNLTQDTILTPSRGAVAVGAGAPPVPTPDGLLLFYHQREQSGQYTIRVALLDDENGRVKSLLPEPLMRPELPWERNGNVDNVIFVQGAVPQPDGTIYLSYGAADRCVGAATVDTAEIIAALRTAP